MSKANKMHTQYLLITCTICFLLTGCSHHAVPAPPSVPPTASISPATTSSISDDASLRYPNTPQAAQQGNTIGTPTGVSEHDKEWMAKVTQDGKAVTDYSSLFMQTLDTIKQAETTALTEDNSSNAHLRIVNAQALMDKAEDTYNSQLSTIVGFGDVDSLMRDGMSQDKSAFSYLDLATTTSDPGTIQDYHSKGEEAYINAGEDFQKARQMLDEHFDQTIQEAKSPN